MVTPVLQGRSHAPIAQCVLGVCQVLVVHNLHHQGTCCWQHVDNDLEMSSSPSLACRRVSSLRGASSLTLLRLCLAGGVHTRQQMHRQWVWVLSTLSWNSEHRTWHLRNFLGMHKQCRQQRHPHSGVVLSALSQDSVQKALVIPVGRLMLAMQQALYFRLITQYLRAPTGYPCKQRFHGELLTGQCLRLRHASLLLHLLARCTL